jgi:hypothetical protein
VVGLRCNIQTSRSPEDSESVTIIETTVLRLGIAIFVESSVEAANVYIAPYINHTVVSVTYDDFDPPCRDKEPLLY